MLVCWVDWLLQRGDLLICWIDWLLNRGDLLVCWVTVRNDLGWILSYSALHCNSNLILNWCWGLLLNDLVITAVNM